MNLKRTAILAAVMGVAGVMMYLTLPISGSIAGVITSLLDATFGDAWAPVPILNLAPLFLVYVIYCMGIGAILWFLMLGGSEPYPPTDEHGRPMVASFSSRGGTIRFVRRP